MKKAIAVTLAMMLILTFAACGGNPASQTDTGSASDTTAASADDTSASGNETTAEEGGELQETGHFIYDHVVVVGVDGAGQYIRDAETPNFDRIFENGSVTYGAYSVYPTISAQNWGAMLTGVRADLHGRTNDNLTQEKYPVAEFPTLYKRIRDAHPDSVLGSYCEWEPITRGLVEEDVKIEYENCADKYLGRFIKKYITEKKPEFLFIQFDSVDAAGHGNGYGSNAQLEQIAVVDGYINEVYSAIEEAGIADSTLFIVITDHGGTNNGEGNSADHGGWTDSEKYDTFAVVGKSVKAGEMGYANVRDLSAVVLYALGIEAPEFDLDGWTSQIPANLFDEKDVPEYNNFYADDGKEPET